MFHLPRPPTVFNIYHRFKQRPPHHNLEADKSKHVSPHTMMSSHTRPVVGDFFQTLDNKVKITHTNYVGKTTEERIISVN